MSNRHPWYNFDKIESYNATMNFICGGRGIGKTFGRKHKAIANAIYKDRQFIYLRRYKTELTLARATFFADVEYKFPKWDFRIVGAEAQCAHISTRDDKKREWRTIGYFVALSTAQSMKSVSFAKVWEIIFDEFIIEKGGNPYIADESMVFNNFYSTVDRWKDQVRVWFLANAVTIMNPYFIAYEIRPDQDGDIIVKAGGYMAAHFPDSEAFSNSVFQTRFGRFIQGSEYAEYAVGNQFSDNNDAMIALKDANARYLFTLETKIGSFSVWNSIVNDEYFIQRKRPKAEIIFTIVPERMDAHKTLMTFNDRPMQYLRGAFRSGRVCFDAPTTRNAFADVFTR
jgi:hypothetical protein